MSKFNYQPGGYMPSGFSQPLQRFGAEQTGVSGFNEPLQNLAPLKSNLLYASNDGIVSFDAFDYIKSFQDNGREGALNSIDDQAMLTWANSQDQAAIYAENLKQLAKRKATTIDDYSVDASLREKMAKYYTALQKRYPEAGKTLQDMIDDAPDDEIKEIKSFIEENPDLGQKLIEMTNIRQALDNDKEIMINERIGKTMYGKHLEEQYEQQMPAGSFADELNSKQEELDSLYGPLVAVNSEGGIEQNVDRAKAERDWLEGKRAENASFLGNNWLGNAFMKVKAFTYGTINAMGSVANILSADLLPDSWIPNWNVSSKDNDPTYSDDYVSSSIDHLSTIIGSEKTTQIKMPDDPLTGSGVQLVGGMPRVYMQETSNLQPSKIDPSRKVVIIDKNAADYNIALRSTNSYLRANLNGPDQLTGEAREATDVVSGFTSAMTNPIFKMMNAFGADIGVADLDETFKAIKFLTPSDQLSALNKQGKEGFVSPKEYLREKTKYEDWADLAQGTLEMGADMTYGSFAVAGKGLSIATKLLSRTTKAIGEIKQITKAMDLGAGLLGKVAEPAVMDNILQWTMKGIQSNEKAARAYKLLTEVGKASPRTAALFALQHTLADRTPTTSEIEQSLVSGAAFGAVIPILSESLTSLSKSAYYTLGPLNRNIQKAQARLALKSGEIDPALYESMMKSLNVSKVQAASRLGVLARSSEVLAETLGFPLSSAVTAGVMADDDKFQAMIDHLSSEEIYAEMLQGFMFKTLMPHKNMLKQREKLNPNSPYSTEEIDKMPDYTTGLRDFVISAQQARNSHKYAKQHLSEIEASIAAMYDETGRTFYQRRKEEAAESDKVSTEPVSPKDGEALFTGVEGDFDSEDIPLEDPTLNLKTIPSLFDTESRPIESKPEEGKKPIEAQNAEPMQNTPVAENEQGPQRVSDKEAEFVSTEEFMEGFIQDEVPKAPITETSESQIAKEKQPAVTTEIKEEGEWDNGQESIPPPTDEQDYHAGETHDYDGGAEGPQSGKTGEEKDAPRNTVERVPKSEGDKLEGVSSPEQPGTTATPESKPNINRGGSRNKKKSGLKAVVKNIFATGHDYREKASEWHRSVLLKALHPLEAGVYYDDGHVKLTQEDLDKSALASEFGRLLRNDPLLAKTVAWDFNGAMTLGSNAAGRMLEKMIILNKMAGSSTYQHEKMHRMKQNLPSEQVDKLIGSMGKFMSSLPEDNIMHEIARHYRDRKIQQLIEKGRIKNTRYLNAGRAPVLAKEINDSVMWELICTMSEGAYTDLPKNSEELSAMVNRKGHIATVQHRSDLKSDFRETEMPVETLKLMRELSECGFDSVGNLSIMDNTGQFRKMDQYETMDDVRLAIKDRIKLLNGQVADMVRKIDNSIAISPEGNEELNEMINELALKKQQLRDYRVADVKYSGDEEALNIVQSIEGMLNDQDAMQSAYKEYIGVGSANAARMINRAKKAATTRAIMDNLYNGDFDRDGVSSLNTAGEFLITNEEREALSMEDKKRLTETYNGNLIDLNSFFNDDLARQKVMGMLPDKADSYEEKFTKYQKLAKTFADQNDINQQAIIAGNSDRRWMNESDLKRLTYLTTLRHISKGKFVPHMKVHIHEGSITFSEVTAESRESLTGMTVVADKMQDFQLGFNQFQKAMKDILNMSPTGSDTLKTLSIGFQTDLMPLAATSNELKAGVAKLVKVGNKLAIKYDGKIYFSLPEGASMKVKEDEGKKYTPVYNFNAWVDQQMAANKDMDLRELESKTIKLSFVSGREIDLASAHNISGQQLRSGIKLLPIGDNATVGININPMLDKIGLFTKGDKVSRTSFGINDIGIDRNNAPSVVPEAQKRLGALVDFVNKGKSELINRYLSSDNVLGRKVDEWVAKSKNGRTYNLLDYFDYGVDEQGKIAISDRQGIEQFIQNAKIPTEAVPGIKKEILDILNREGSIWKFHAPVKSRQIKAFAQIGGSIETKILSFDGTVKNIIDGSLFDTNEDGTFKHISFKALNADKKLESVAFTPEKWNSFSPVMKSNLINNISKEVDEIIGSGLFGNMDMLQMSVLDVGMGFADYYSRKDGKVKVGKAIEKYISSVYRPGYDLQPDDLSALHSAVYKKDPVFMDNKSLTPLIYKDKDGDWAMRSLYVEQANEMLKTYFPESEVLQQYFSELFNDAGTVFTSDKAQQIFASLSGNIPGCSMKNEFVCYDGQNKVHVKHAMHNPGLFDEDPFLNEYVHPDIKSFFELLRKHHIGMIVPSTATKMNGTFRTNIVKIDGKEYHHNGKRIVGREDNGKVVIDDDISKGIFIAKDENGGRILQDDNGKLLNTIDMKLTGRNAIRHMPQFTTMSRSAYAYPQTPFELPDMSAYRAISDIYSIYASKNIDEATHLLNLVGMYSGKAFSDEHIERLGGSEAALSKTISALESMKKTLKDRVNTALENPAVAETASVKSLQYALDMIDEKMPKTVQDLPKLIDFLVKSDSIFADDSQLSNVPMNPSLPQAIIQSYGNKIADALEGRFRGSKATLVPHYAPMAACVNGIYFSLFGKGQWAEKNGIVQTKEQREAIVRYILKADWHKDDPTNMSVDINLASKAKEYLYKQGFIDPAGNIVGVDHKTGLLSSDSDVLIVSPDYISKGVVRVGDKVFAGIMPHDTEESIAALRVVGVGNNTAKHNMSYNPKLMIEFQGKDFDIDTGCIINPRLLAPKLGNSDKDKLTKAQLNLWHYKHDIRQTHKGQNKQFILAVKKIVESLPSTITQSGVVDGREVTLPGTNWFRTDEIVDEYMKLHSKDIFNHLRGLNPEATPEEQRQYVKNMIEIHPSMQTFGRNSSEQITDIVGTSNYANAYYKYKQSRIGIVTSTLNVAGKLMQKFYDPSKGGTVFTVTLREPTAKESDYIEMLEGFEAAVNKKVEFDESPYFNDTHFQAKLNFDKFNFWQSLGKEGAVDIFSMLGIKVNNPYAILAHMLFDDISSLSSKDFGKLTDSLQRFCMANDSAIERNYKESKLGTKKAQLSLLNAGTNSNGSSISVHNSDYDNLIKDSSSMKLRDLLAAKPRSLQNGYAALFDIKVKGKSNTTNGSIGRIAFEVDKTIRGSHARDGLVDGSFDKRKYVMIDSDPNVKNIEITRDYYDGKKTLAEVTTINRDLNVLTGRLEQEFSNLNSGHGITMDDNIHIPGEAVSASALYFLVRTADIRHSPISAIDGKGNFVYTSENPFEIFLPEWYYETVQGVKRRYVKISKGKTIEGDNVFGDYKLSVDAFAVKKEDGGNDIKYRFTLANAGIKGGDTIKHEISMNELFNEGQTDFGEDFVHVIDVLSEQINGSPHPFLANRADVVDYITRSITHDFSNYAQFDRIAPLLLGEVGRNVSTKSNIQIEAISKYPEFLASEKERSGAGDNYDRKKFVDRVAGEMCNSFMGREYALTRNDNFNVKEAKALFATGNSSMSNAQYEQLRQLLFSDTYDVMTGKGFRDSAREKADKNLTTMNRHNVTLMDRHSVNPILLLGTNNQLRANFHARKIDPKLITQDGEVRFEDKYSEHIQKIMEAKNAKIKPRQVPLPGDEGEFALLSYDGESVPPLYRTSKSFDYVEDNYTEQKSPYYSYLKVMNDTGLNNPELTKVVVSHFKEMAQQAAGIRFDEAKEPWEQTMARFINQYSSSLADNLDAWLDPTNPNREVHLSNVIRSLPRYLQEIAEARAPKNPNSRFIGHYIANGIVSMDKCVKMSMLKKSANKIVVDSKDRLFAIRSEVGTGFALATPDYSMIPVLDGSSLDPYTGKMMTTLEQVHTYTADGLIGYINDFTEHNKSFVNNIFEHIHNPSKVSKIASLEDRRSCVILASTIAREASNLFMDHEGSAIFKILNEQAKTGATSDYTMVMTNSKGDKIYADFVSHGDESWRNMADEIINRINTDGKKKEILDKLVGNQLFRDKDSIQSFTRDATISYLKSKLLLNGYIPGMLRSYRATLIDANRKYYELTGTDSADYTRISTAISSLLAESDLSAKFNHKGLSYYPQSFRSQGELHNYYRVLLERCQEMINNKQSLKDLRPHLRNIGDTFNIFVPMRISDENLVKLIQDKLPEAFEKQSTFKGVDKIRPVSMDSERTITLTSSDTGMPIVPMNLEGMLNYVEKLSSGFSHTMANMMENMYHMQRERLHRENGTGDNLYHVEEVTGLFRSMRGDTYNYSTTIDKTTNLSEIPTGTPLVLRTLVPDRLSEGINERMRTGYFLGTDSKEGREIIIMYNPNNRRIERVNRQLVDMGMQGTSIGKLAKRYHNSVANLLNVSIPESLQSIDMNNNIQENWNLNPDILAKKDKVARLVLNTTYIPRHLLVSAAIKTAAGIGAIAFAPPAAMGLFVGAGKDTSRFAMSIVKRAAGNIIGGNRSDIVVRGFSEGMSKTLHGFWDRIHSSNKVVQERANQTNLRTFTEDFNTSNKAQTIQNKVERSSDVRRYFKNQIRRVKTLDELNRDYESFQRGEITEDQWMEHYDNTQNILLRAEGTNPNEIVETLKKHYGYDELLGGFLDSNGHALADLIDLKRKSQRNTLDWMTNGCNWMPTTEIKSTQIAQTSGLEWAQERGSFSDVELRAIARAYREMSVGAYGITARLEVESTLAGQVFGLFRRYSQSMNNYLIHNLKSGRGRRHEEQVAGTLFEQFNPNMFYTSDGKPYKPHEYKLSGAMGMGAMGIAGSTLSFVGWMILNALGEDSTASQIINDIGMLDESTSFAGHNNIFGSIAKMGAGAVMGTTFFQVQSDKNVLDQLSKGKISPSEARAKMKLYFGNMSKGSSGIIPGLGMNSVTGIVNDALTYLALNTMPNTDTPGGRLITGEYLNRASTNLVMSLLSLNPSARGYTNVAKSVAESVAKVYDEYSRKKNDHEIYNPTLGNIMGGLGVPGTVSEKDHLKDSKRYQSIRTARAAQRRKK